MIEASDIFKKILFFNEKKKKNLIFQLLMCRAF